MSIRLYIRSVHRTFLNQWKIFLEIKNIFLNLTQIREQKAKIGNTLNLSKEKLERKQELINSKKTDITAQSFDFVR
jgi:hypothetical protein